MFPVFDDVGCARRYREYDKFVERMAGGTEGN